MKKTQALAKSKQTLEIGSNVSLTETCAVLKLGLSAGEWRHIAQCVSRVSYGFQWWIGDMLAYAQHYFSPGEFDGSLKYLVKSTNLTDKYLRRLMYTAQIYKKSERNSRLSIAHHMNAMYEPTGKRRLMLEQAESKRTTAEGMMRKARGKDFRVKVIISFKSGSPPPETFFHELRDFLSKYEGCKFYREGNSGRKKQGTKLLGKHQLVEV